jgi:hypothetical protein
VTDISGTAEAKLRANVPGNISFVVLVEGIGVPELASVRAQLVDIASAASSATCEAGVYRLAYMLDASASLTPAVTSSRAPFPLRPG